MSEPKLPSWMNYSDYEDIMHYLRLFGEMKPYYLKAEDVFNAEQEVMKRKMDDGLRLIDVAKEMIWSYKYKERWHQLPKVENMDLTEAKQILKNAGYILEDTETQDDEYNELHRKYDDAVRDTLPNADTLKRKTIKLYYKHLDLDDKIDNAKKFNSNIDKMKKDAVNIFKQAFYEDEVTDNGDGTYTVIPDSDYDIKAIYKWDDNDTLTCKFNYTNNTLSFKHLSRHLNYDPKGGPWQEGQWSGDEELENFITDLSFEYQNAMSY